MFTPCLPAPAPVGPTCFSPECQAGDQGHSHWCVDACASLAQPSSIPGSRHLARRPGPLVGPPPKDASCPSREEQPGLPPPLTCFLMKGGERCSLGAPQDSRHEESSNCEDIDSRHSSGANACTNIRAAICGGSVLRFAANLGPCCFLLGEPSDFSSSVIWELKRLLYLVKSYIWMSFVNCKAQYTFKWS